MKMLKKSLFIVFISCFFAIFVSDARAEVAIPKITKLTIGENVVAAGTTSDGTEILIYIDGVFACQIAPKIAQNKNELNFQCSIKQKLADGAHAIMAIAQDSTSLVLSAPTDEIRFAVNALPAPTLIAPNKKTVTAETKPLISGLVKSESAAKIFIDGIYDGRTDILRHESGTANFAYEPLFDLRRGRHEISAVAEDETGKTSRMSETLSFDIELPMSAPIILKTVLNNQSLNAMPFIVGLAKNDSKIKIYIDKKYDGESLVKNHPSGAANFAYKPFNALSRGRHSVYAVAVDGRGKQSDLSNKIDFSVKIASIAQSASEEQTRAVAKIEDAAKKSGADLDVAAISASSGEIEKKQDVRTQTEDQAVGQNAQDADASGNVAELIERNQAGLEKINELTQISENEKLKTAQGMIDEDKSSQGKLKLSVVLFILFFIGASGWLLWVNRELVKERRKQNENENAEKQSNDNQTDA